MYFKVHSLMGDVYELQQPRLWVGSLGHSTEIQKVNSSVIALNYSRTKSTLDPFKQSLETSHDWIKLNCNKMNYLLKQNLTFFKRRRQNLDIQQCKI